MRKWLLIILALGCQTVFVAAAVSDTDFDPNSPEGKQRIENYKTHYIEKCTLDGMDRLAPNDSAIRDSFEMMFRATCTCGVTRGLSTFSDADFQHIELSIANETANQRMRKATADCVDDAMKKLDSQN